MNTDLLRDVRDQIAAEPEHFDMDHWYGADVVGDTPANACGTTACIAGWTLALNEGTKHLTLGGLFDASNGPRAWRAGGRSISDLAEEVLDITDDQAWALFYVTHWPSHYFNMAEEEGDAKAAVSLLDDILDGLTVWDENRREWVYLPNDVVADEEVPA